MTVEQLGSSAWAKRTQPCLARQEGRAEFADLATKICQEVRLLDSRAYLATSETRAILQSLQGREGISTPGPPPSFRQRGSPSPLGKRSPLSSDRTRADSQDRAKNLREPPRIGAFRGAAGPAEARPFDSPLSGDGVTTPGLAPPSIRQRASPSPLGTRGTPVVDRTRADSQDRATNLREPPRIAVIRTQNGGPEASWLHCPNQPSVSRRPGKAEFADLSTNIYQEVRPLDSKQTLGTIEHRGGFVTPGQPSPMIFQRRSPSPLAKQCPLSAERIRAESQDRKTNPREPLQFSVVRSPMTDQEVAAPILLSRVVSEGHFSDTKCRPVPLASPPHSKPSSLGSLSSTREVSSCASACSRALPEAPRSRQQQQSSLQAQRCRESLQKWAEVREQLVSCLSSQASAQHQHVSGS